MHTFEKLLRNLLPLFIFSLLVSPVIAGDGAELLTRPWYLSTTKEGAAQKYQLIDPNALKNYDTLQINVDLNGVCLLGGDASALVFDQPIGRVWRFVSLSSYVKNCATGMQVVRIPLSDFRGLDLTRAVGTFHVRIWQKRAFSMAIGSAKLTSEKASLTSSNSILSTITPLMRPTVTFTVTSKIIRPTATHTYAPTVTSAPLPVFSSRRTSSWSIQSVSSMKETKDRVCNPRSADSIAKWVNKAVELGVNYIAIETPYDSPSCGSSIAYASAWINAIRARGLKVWHRHMPMSFEGIYGAKKNKGADYLSLIRNYIKTNRYFFAEGDIFTPIPEPQNGGIKGVTYCSGSICIFDSARQFNTWLRDAIDVSEAAFSTIGMAGKIQIGYYGFDGFVTWGDNNPDWSGILENATVAKMGNITIDHYPEAVGDTMDHDLSELEARYPNIPIVIGEWGTITGGNTVDQVRASMNAARRPSVVGFNYWHMGMGGKEALLNDDYSERPPFKEVQAIYRALR